jgi:hypothetical protein
VARCERQVSAARTALAEARAPRDCYARRAALLP